MADHQDILSPDLSVINVAAVVAPAVVICLNSLLLQQLRVCFNLSGQKRGCIQAKTCLTRQHDRHPFIICSPDLRKLTVK